MTKMHGTLRQFSDQYTGVLHMSDLLMDESESEFKKQSYLDNCSKLHLLECIYMASIRQMTVFFFVKGPLT